MNHDGTHPMKYEEPGFRVEVLETHPAFGEIRGLVQRLLAASVPGVRESLPDKPSENGGDDGTYSREDFERLVDDSKVAQGRYLDEFKYLADGAMKQLDLEKKLRLDKMEFRALHIGLAKICKRLRVPYPLVSAGTARADRHFGLQPDFWAHMKAHLGTK